jgi:asparagine synthase (glutamine-hydrolysing)
MNIEYELPSERKEIFYIMNNLDPESAITYFEQKTYLSGLLRRLDRMSMANSIESRVPFLDYRIVEYMNRIPLRKKIGLTQNSVKKILKEISADYLPDIIINRQKRGFSTPVNTYKKPGFISPFSGLTNEEAWNFFSVRTVKSG